jgi:putative holliday junction resolvase
LTKPHSLKTLALDVGDARVGVALSDATGFLASPLTIIKRGAGTVAEIAALVQKHEITTLLVGLPLNMDGTKGFQAKKVERFAEKIKEAMAETLPAQAAHLSIIFEDERVSTQDARELRLQRGVKKMKRRERVDAEAAAIFLQEYLDRQRSERLKAGEKI